MTLLLPLELIDAIIDHLVEPGYEYLDNDTSSSLKAVSLVCRSFVAPSQSRLFATITLRSPPHNLQCVECGLREVYIISTHRQLKSTIAAFSRVTAASPHLLGYVRRLDLYGSPRSPSLSGPSPPASHTEWLSSQSHHLTTFIPNLAPRLSGFGLHDVDWNELSPEVVDAINSILKSSHLASLYLEETANIPIPVLASCGHLQHLTLQIVGGHESTVTPPNTWDGSALAWGPSLNRQKSRLISLKLFAQDSIIDWFSMENCLFDISHLRQLVLVRGGHNLTKFFQTCSKSLESFEMEVDLDYPNIDYDAINISSLTRLRKAQFIVPLTPSSSTIEPRISLSWVNELLIRQSRMSVFEEIILDCYFFLSIISVLAMFSKTDSILARREVFPALRFVTVLVPNKMAPPLGYDEFNIIETIKIRMPLLDDMGILRVNRRR